jgi:hypothetical protein
MRFKGTIILLLILAAFGGFVYYYEVKGGKQRQEKEEAAKKLLGVDKDKITEISLIYSDKTITGVRKHSHHWLITQPFETEANDEEWERITTNLADLQKEKVLDEHPKDLKDYGLEPPALKAVVKSDGRSTEVHFGQENPTGASVYAKLPGKPEVVLAPATAFNAIKKNLSDLREQGILRFNEFDAKEIRLKNPQGEFALVKDGRGWKLTAPVDSKAEHAEVTTILNALSLDKVKEYLDSNPPSEKEARLDQPTMDVTVFEDKEKKEEKGQEGAPAKSERIKERLLVGRRKDNDRYYAKDESRKEIFLIDKTVFDKLNKSLFDLRDKSILSFRRGDIDAIEISSGKGKLILKKEQADWLIKEPGAEGASGGSEGKQKAQFSKVVALFETLEKNKVKDFIDRPAALTGYGLEKPKVEVTFKKGDEVLAQFAFGSDARPTRKLDEKGPFCYFKNKSENDVKIISKEVLEKFAVSKTDLIQPEKEASVSELTRDALTPVLSITF